MRSSSSFKRILLYRGVVDFRKWLSGLAMIVEHEMGENLMTEYSGPRGVNFFVARLPCARKLAVVVR